MSVGHRLSGLEVASGMVLGGSRPADRPIPSEHPAQTPLRALEAAVLPGLERAPCLVSFSGGMDSSVVLAVADRVARQRGLARPIPVTFRFTNAPDSDEDAAQERVIDALAISHWERIHLDDDAHMLGPFATETLRRHGLLHPANAFLHLPLLQRAGAGSLLTGVGGDQILGGGWRRPPHRRRPWWWPGRGGIGGRPAPRFEWLRPVPARRARRQLARERAGQPPRFDDRLVWHSSRRDLRLALHSLALLASGTAAQVVNPLVDPGFVAALAVRGGAAGFAPPGLAGRSTLLASVFPELPPDVIAFRRKANLRQAFWREPTTAFLSSWDGTGLDERFIDAEALRRLWRQPHPPSLTALLAQQVWLHHQATHGAEKSTR